MMRISQNLKVDTKIKKGFLSEIFFYSFFILFLTFSLFFHFLCFKNLKGFELSSFNPSFFDTIIPRYINLKRVEINSTFLEEQKISKLSLVPVEINFLEKGTPCNQNYFSNNFKNSEIKIEEFEKEKTNHLLKNQLIFKTKTPPQELSIEWEQINSENKNSLKSIVSQQNNSLENYSQLEQLLEQNRLLTSKTAPILLPADILFEYNIDQLKTDAEKSLEKLAILIKRNPKAEFMIEGFTDSFGSEEYNLDLSQRRADSIKKWLLSNQLVDGSKIKTHGFGKSHFLVPSNGTIEQQQLNRRVEIVIHQ